MKRLLIIGAGGENSTPFVFEVEKRGVLFCCDR